jgi:hypothetical protein
LAGRQDQAATIGDRRPHTTAAARFRPRALNASTDPVGLLGSDVLSRYGKVAIDYNRALLILDPRLG